MDELRNTDENVTGIRATSLRTTNDVAQLALCTHMIVYLNGGSFTLRTYVLAFDNQHLSFHVSLVLDASEH